MESTFLVVPAWTTRGGMAHPLGLVSRAASRPDPPALPSLAPPGSAPGSQPIARQGLGATGGRAARASGSLYSYGTNLATFFLPISCACSCAQADWP